MEVKMKEKEIIQLSTELILSLTNGVALAVWVYLCSRPKGSKIIKEEIKKHFSMGDKKLNLIMSHLVKKDLLRIRSEQAKNGRFITTEYVLNEKNLY